MTIVVAGPATAATWAAEPNVDAAELVRKLYAQERWIDDAQSVYIRLERRTEFSDAARERDAKKPKNGVFYERRSSDGLKPFTTEEVFAWDRSRAFHREAHQSPGGSLDGLVRIKMWDGHLGTDHSKSPRHDQTSLIRDYAELFHIETQLVPWGDPHGHKFWWQITEFARAEFLTPEDFEYVGREDVEGRACHVVQSRPGHRRFYIGVADARRYRYEWFHVANDIELLRKVGGAKIKNHRDWWTWRNALPPDEQRRADRELAVLQFDTRRPSIDNTLDDYREVAPGRRLPYRVVSKLYNSESGEPSVEWTAEQTITEVRVDQPLADDLFEFQIPEGSRVSDWRYDPAIVYKYRKDRTEADRLALVEAERARQAAAKREFDEMRKTINARVGQQPPPLPREGWIGAEPLAWEDLRGKAVMLHFWDTDCPPCENEMPFLQQAHEAKDDKLAIIGIHRHTYDLVAVRKKLKSLGVKYPVFIDAPTQGSPGLGRLHDWFGNAWWPNTVVIDKRGTFAAYGPLHEVMSEARRLADDDPADATPTEKGN